MMKLTLDDVWSTECIWAGNGGINFNDVVKLHESELSDYTHGRIGHTNGYFFKSDTSNSCGYWIYAYIGDGWMSNCNKPSIVEPFIAVSVSEGEVDECQGGPLFVAAEMRELADILMWIDSEITGIPN